MDLTTKLWIIFIIITAIIIVFGLVKKKSSFFYKEIEEDDDELLKEYLRKKYQRIIDKEDERFRDYKLETVKMETRIVDIHKPIGKWTRMIISQQLQYISNVKHLIGDKLSGIWQIRVKAQAQSKGREHAKGVGKGGRSR